MSFAVVLEGMTLIAYIVIMAGGKQKREQGWQVLASLHVACAVLLGAAMSLTVCEREIIRRGYRRLIHL